MRRRLRVAFLVGLGFAAVAGAQWSPAGQLAGVPVSADCTRTANAPAAAADGPQIFTCPEAVAAIEQETSGASEFFLVHEYGHFALGDATETEADCWASRELAQAPNGAQFIDAVATWLEARANDFDSRFGTAGERATRIRECSGLEIPPVTMGRRCCSAERTCEFLPDDAARPVGESCYCTETEASMPAVGGRVCS